MLNRSVSPVAFSSPSISFRQPETKILSNNITVHSFLDNKFETVKLEFIFPNAGSICDKKAGINLLVAKCLQSGTKSFSATEISSMIAQAGAFIEVSPSFDHSTLTLYCIRRHLKKLLPVVKEILQNPTFPIDEVNRQIVIAKTNLQTQLKKSSILASRELRKQLFPSSPYGRSPSIDDLNNIEQQNLLQHYQDWYGYLEIIASGNITEDLLVDIDKNFSKVSSSHTAFSYPTDRTKNRVNDRHIAIENSVQSSIRIGKEVSGKNSDDFNSLFVSNHLLGGFFGSRLMKNLREDKGLTYGVYSSVIDLKHGAYIVIGCDVKADQKELAITEITRELDKLKTSKINDGELSIVKNHLLGSIQNDLSSLNALSSKFKNIHYQGLSYDYYDDLIKTIKTITPSAVRDIANKYLSEENFSKVIVGG